MTDNIIERLAQLAQNLTDDIRHAKNREEHIRSTARANAASELLNLINEPAEDGPASDPENISS